MFASLFTALALPFVFASVTIQSYICQPPTVPVISSPADGSTVAAGTMQISGNATASSQVTLSIDGQPAVQTTADQFNNFSAQLSLSAGSHSIGITSNTPCGSQGGSSITLTAVAPPPGSQGSSGSHNPPILRHPLPPFSTGDITGASPGTTITSGSLTLTVDSPQDGSRVTAASVFIRGTTSKAALVRVLVGGTEVSRTLQPSTSFGFGVPLNVGSNELTVEATSDSDQASAKLHVIRLASESGQTSKSAVSTPWWRTTPGKILITICVILMLGLIIWVIR